MRYEIHHRDAIFEVITHGPAEVPTFKTFMDELVAHPEWEPGSLMLHDHSDLRTESLTVQDVSRIADVGAELREPLGRAKLAVLLRRDLEFGLARMWGTFIDGRWDVTADLFRSRDDAIGWLREPPLAATAHR